MEKANSLVGSSKKKVLILVIIIPSVAIIVYFAIIGLYYMIFRQTIEGEEYSPTETPGSIWLGRISLLPLVWITGIDKYLVGKGKMRKMIYTKYNE